MDGPLSLSVPTVLHRIIKHFFKQRKHTKCQDGARNTTAIRVVKFLNGGYKIRFFLPKYLQSTYQKKSLNFKFWINGEL